MIAFFCATPYQILIAIQIKTNHYQGIDADIYVLNHFKDSAITTKKLAGQKIFRNVKEVSASLDFTRSISGKSRFRHFVKIFSYYNYSLYAFRFFNIKDQVYDHVFFSYADVIIQLGLKRILANNKNCKIHLFEDGVGGYLSFGTNTNQKKKLFNWLTLSGGLENYVDLHAFAPELMYKTSLPVVKIPNIKHNDLAYIKQLNEIFGYKSGSINHKFVVLEQPLDFVPVINELQFSTFEELQPYDYVIKRHPRSNSKISPDFNLFKNSETPWEIICLNSNLKDKVLISYNSTAAISNKLIFDVEVPIIFLYELSEFKRHYSVSSELDAFLRNFKANCREPEMIFFPKDLGELRHILRMLNSQ